MDPRRSFEPGRLPVEIRWDPLLGSQLSTPPARQPPPALIDLEELAKQSRSGCPFCAPDVEQQTPRFPPEVWPEGRIKCSEVARSYFALLLRSDAMWSERLHWEAAVDLAPETVAELGRARFSRAA
jgi:hypothetical protein